MAHAFSFIHRENHGATCFAQIVGNDLIVRIQARATIDQKHHQVRFDNRLAGLLGHFVINTLFGNRLEATRVNHQKWTFTHTPFAVMAVARQPRVVRHDGIA